MWATRFGLQDSIDGRLDYASFVANAKHAGTTSNGVFAARVMWGTIEGVVGGLASERRTHGDLSVLVEAFGPLRFVYLHRSDVVAQAVSWARAEQSGYWHRGDASSRDPRFDFEQIDSLVATIRAHNAAWLTWFEAQGVQPLVLSYESVIEDPSAAVRDVLAEIGVTGDPEWTVHSQHEKQGDGLNEDWARRYAAGQGIHRDFPAQLGL